MATSKIALNSAGWTLLATGAAQDVLVQLQGNGPILINYAGSDPGAGTTFGVMLETGKLETLTFTALADNVYGRAPFGNSGSTVIVMET